MKTRTKIVLATSAVIVFAFSLMIGLVACVRNDARSAASIEEFYDIR